jgi:putative ABC transport system ATP-binding protein
VIAPVVELSGVGKVFHGGRHNAFAALREVDLRLAPGRLTVLRGPSGSGKTTLLSIVACLQRPTTGRVRVGDEEVTGLPERFLASIRRSTFGVVFQQFQLVAGLSVRTNVMLPAYPTGRTRREIGARADLLLERLGLSALADEEVERLSGGEQQRAAIARALVNDPPVVLADEPTAQLDSELSADVLAVLAGLRDEGRTVVVASHDPRVCDAPAVDEVVSLRDGRIVP